MRDRPFSWKAPWFWSSLLGLTVLRLIWAATVPLGNDEVYYWDWSRVLQWSYLDHPPAVAWIARLGGVFASGALGARFVVPFMHLGATLFLVASLKWIKNYRPETREVGLLLFLTQLVPVFSLGGFFLMPDAGLIFGISWALYAVYRVHRRTASLLFSDGLICGVGLGICGLSKYHALPLGGGLMAGLLLARRDRWRDDLGFFTGVVLAGALVSSPVWGWNLANGFASFRFQGAHGFADLEWRFLSGLRTIGAQMLMLTPMVFLMILAMVIVDIRDHSSLSHSRVIGLAAFLPLFLLLEGLAFFKNTLPHWIMPAFWVLLPGFCVSWHPHGKAWKSNAALAVVLTLALPWLFAIPPVRQRLVESFHGKPGALGEYTLWPSLDSRLAAHPWFKEYFSSEPPRPGDPCPSPPALATLRWFWTAQLAFTLPGQPRVLALDPERPSYYTFRDDLSALRGCPVLVVGDRRHYYPEKLAAAITVEAVESLEVNDHQDVPIVVIKGRFR